MITAGRYGDVKYGVDLATAVHVASLDKWKLSLATGKIKTTTFGDTNEVYLPGMRDVSGNVSGYLDSDDLTLIAATELSTPGILVLVPDTNQAAFVFSGPAWLDAEIDTDVAGAPKMTGNFMAAGTWTIPAGSLVARAA